MNISKDDFISYEVVRASGITNMNDLETVEELSGLSREKIKYIMKHYGELMEKYPNVRG